MVHFLLTCQSPAAGLIGRPWSYARLLAVYPLGAQRGKQHRALQQLRECLVGGSGVCGSLGDLTYLVVPYLSQIDIGSGAQSGLPRAFHPGLVHHPCL